VPEFIEQLRQWAAEFGAAAKERIERDRHRRGHAPMLRHRAPGGRA